jgi:hypothetical protein
MLMMCKVVSSVVAVFAGYTSEFVDFKLITLQICLFEGVTAGALFPERHTMRKMLRMSGSNKIDKKASING